MISTQPIQPMSHPPATTQAAVTQSERLHEAAQALEAQFLAEMLRAAGFGRAQDAFGGGIGEEQFSSFLVDHQAKALVERGGIGLAESLFAALSARIEITEGGQNDN